MADLNVTFRAPSIQLSITLTSSVSIILQHWPTDVTGFTILKPFALNGVDGTAYDSQYPRHAFVLMENWTQSGISITLLWPAPKIKERQKKKRQNKSFFVWKIF